MDLTKLSGLLSWQARARLPGLLLAAPFFLYSFSVALSFHSRYLCTRSSPSWSPSGVLSKPESDLKLNYIQPPFSTNTRPSESAVHAVSPIRSMAITVMPPDSPRNPSMNNNPHKLPSPHSDEHSISYNPIRFSTNKNLISQVHHMDQISQRKLTEEASAIEFHNPSVSALGCPSPEFHPSHSHSPSFNGPSSQLILSEADRAELEEIELVLKLQKRKADILAKSRSQI